MIIVNIIFIINVNIIKFASEYDFSHNMKTINKILIYSILILTFVNNPISCQTVLKQDADDGVNNSYLYPWAGGMDALQYCEIDLNIDGIMDLLVFDRRGNRNMCFINGGLSNTTDYRYAPEYSLLLPTFSEWVIFRDYNMDGKNDIFTYSPGYGSMMVYKNISADSLKFELVAYPYLETHYPGGWVNLFVTNADYPGIADVDYDGDLDILTFGVLGSFIDMHKNMSMELYGTPDSLYFEHYTYCWGKIAESDESNKLYFDTCLPGSYLTPPAINRKDRHTGSTLLLHDLDDNGQIDLLLGDVDYPKLFALYNSGNYAEAIVTKADTLFPDNTHAVWMFSMPCASYMDVNNDNIKDLLVSPFDPGIITSRNKTSSWLYLNNGQNTNPVFEYPDVSFLQNNMIDVGSGAYPVVFDWDGDGLKDLFIGNYGYYDYSYYINYTLHSVYKSKIAYFKNIGTYLNPIFQLWDNDFAGLGSLNKIGLIPSFNDIDGDGYTDILVGDSEGHIMYVKNMHDDEFEIYSENYLEIDVGEFSTPQLFDINKDGIKDLIIGEKAGNINYYLNHGEGGVSDFVFVTDSLGKVNVTDYTLSWNGYSVPHFFRDDNNNTHLVVGSEQGKIFYYKAIDNNLDGKFIESNNFNQLLDTTNINLDRGMRTSAVIVDLFANGKLEMIAGNYSGGIEYFNGTADVNSQVSDNYSQDVMNIFPNPSRNSITISLLQSSCSVNVVVYNSNGMICLSKSINSTSKSCSIDISNLVSGLYVVVTQVDGNVYSNRLIIP